MRGAHKDIQVVITRIIDLVGKLQVDVAEKCRPKRPLRASIPTAKLKTLIIRLTKQFVLRMRNDRTDPKFTEEIQLDLFILPFQKMPLLCDIEEQKIGAVVQIIIEPIGLIKSDRRIDTPVIELALDGHILIREYIFRMIEIDLESPSLLFIQQ